MPDNDIDRTRHAAKKRIGNRQGIGLNLHQDIRISGFPTTRGDSKVVVESPHVETTLRIGPRALRGDGRMIQDRTLLRRAVGSLLVTLVTLVGFQVQAQLDFSVSTEITWDEDPAELGNNLIALNDRITEAIPIPLPANTCYTVSGIAALEIPDTSINCRTDGDATKDNNGSTAPGVLQVKANSHVDYDVLTGGSPSQTLIVNAHDTTKKGAVAGKLTIAIKVENYDEQPFSTQNETTNRAPVWYLNKDESRTILISSVFRDPEGAPVYFNSAATSTDVYVCDSDAAGDTSPAGSSAAPNGRTATPADPGAITIGTGGTGTVACSVSNTDAANGIPGTDGNRVVTTRKVGPILHISADSVKVDANGVLDTPTNTDLNDRGSGTYTAKVLFRVWTGADTTASPRLASSNWSMATVHVKIGANNLPQFAGGATGFNTEMEEAARGTSAAPTPADAWNAGDLDIANNVYSDALSYKLEGQFYLASARREVVLRAGGIVWVNEPSETNPNVSLGGFGIDYETAQSFSVNLQVTDEWSEYVSVPITVAVKNVNELEFAKVGDKDKKIADQRLIQGGSRTFDLDDYFVDPEGDDITFSAHTNIYTNVVSVGEGNVLTIKGEKHIRDK